MTSKRAKPYVIAVLLFGLVASVSAYWVHVREVSAIEAARNYPLSQREGVLIKDFLEEPRNPYIHTRWKANQEFNGVVHVELWGGVPSCVEFLPA